MIEFEGVTKRYPDGTVAVDDLSLTVETGQITVFVGPSGCGKTTALRMINRMIEPTSGRILIDGDDITTRPEAQLRREIGYVIQGAGLFPHRTVLDNVATVPILKGVSRRDFIKVCSAAAAAVGLPAWAGEKMAEKVAKGQKPSVVWLHFQECTGCTESLLRTSHPDVGSLILDLISVDYHETLFAAAGAHEPAARACTRGARGGRRPA